MGKEYTKREIVEKKEIRFSVDFSADMAFVKNSECSLSGYCDKFHLSYRWLISTFIQTNDTNTSHHWLNLLQRIGNYI